MLVSSSNVRLIEGIDDPRHLEADRENSNDVETWRNMGDHFPHPYTMEHAKAWMERCASQVPRQHFYIEAEGVVVGGVGVHVREGVHRFTGAVGYYVGRKYWGRGYATRAVELIAAYAFESLKLVRLEAGVFAWNPASIRVLEKAGFEREAVQKRAVFKDGQFTDYVTFVRLESP